MPEQTVTTTQSGGFQQMLEQMFPGLAAQFQGMLGGGADTGAMHGVGDEFMALVQQLQAGPNATQQGGLDTLKQLMDMGYLTDAYKSAYGAITEPTLRNRGIAGGLGEGAITEANALAGAQAGVDVAKMQKDAGTNYGRAQLDVGGGLTGDILRALGGAGSVYGNEASIQQTGHGQDIGALGGFIGNVLGYRPPSSSVNTNYPALPTTVQGWIDLIKGGSGLYQPAKDAWTQLFGPNAQSPTPTPNMPVDLSPTPGFSNVPIDTPALTGAPIDYTTPIF